MNTAGMGIMRGYARQIVERWGRGALFITGEAGDKILPDLPLGQRCRSLEALVEAIDGEFAKVPADRAAAMLGLDAEALRADLADRLGSFPETQAGRKAAHFLIFELHGKSAFEGEDRTRASLWSTTPFFSFRFFRHAMRLPDRLKRDRRLYRRVQVLLSPACAQVSDTTIGLAPSSVLFGPKVKVKRWLFHVFPPGLRWQVRNLIRGAPPPYDASPAMRERIRASLAETDGLGAMLDPHAVETFLGACSQAQFEYFMTVVLLDHLWRTEWSAREVARASSP
jgi:asparagine synthase (glutamine-hydrolysing)